MSSNPPTPEELDLRRRARRRLIGAVALALITILALPMLFEPEPKPLGNDVDIRIPGQDTPFQAPVAPAAAEHVTLEAAASAEPAIQAAPVPAQAAAKPEPAKQAETKVEPAKAPVKTEAAKAEPVKAEAKPVKTEAAKKEEPKKEAAKPASKPGYFVQAGVFSSEQNAKQLVEKLGNAGFKAKIVNISGQSRVRLGPYADKQQAQEVQAKLKAKGFTPVLIAP